MLQRFLKLAAPMFLLFIGFSMSLNAQTSTGQIVGTVTDATGAIIPGAAITITNTGTQAVRTTTSDNSGFFVVTNLPIGDYSVAVKKAGYGSAKRTGLSVVADAHLTADFQLQVGSVTEQVTVTAIAGETLNTTSGELSHVIDTQEVEALPLNGRNYTQVLTLIPGAVVTNPDIFSITTGLNSTNQVVNGNRADSANLTVDGSFNLNSGSNGSIVNNVSPDFIKEVKIETSNFSAEFGRTSGPAFNIVTKGGTNQWHGGTVEYLRNNDLDARPYFSSIKTQLIYNNFGYYVGGPIIKDKLFFFVGEEWKRLRQQQSPSVQTTPSSAQLAGNFAGVAQLNFPGTKNPIPNNNIASMMTTDGKAIASVFTTMNKLGTYTDQTGATNNLTLIPLNPLNYREDIGRIDYTINNKNNIFGRWVDDRNSLIDPFGTFSSSNLPTTPTTRNRPGESYLVSETWSIRPNIINQATASFYFVPQDIIPYGVNNLRSTYGFAYNKLFPGAGPYPLGIPYVTIQNYASFQGPAFSMHSHTTDIQLADTVTMIKGNHLFKFGALYVRDRVDQDGRPQYDGQINFTTSSSLYTTGNALADALLGNFQAYTEANADPTGHFRFNQPEAFVQDTWKIARKLSLELGTRWQLLRPLYAQGNNMSNFDPSVYSPSQVITVTTGGKVVPGTGNPYNGLVRAGNGVPADQTIRVPNVNTAAFPLIPLNAPRGFYDMKGAFGPRVGFAYAPDAKTSIRGGFGVFYYRVEGNVSFSQVNVQPWLQNVEFDNANLSNISGGTPNNTALQGGISAIDPKIKNPYVDDYSFGVQRELPWNMLLETTYVGNLGHHLLRQPNINAPTPAQVATNTSYNSNYFNPYQGFTGISQNLSDSNSNYNALQAYLTKRTGQVTFTSGYTFGKALGDSSTNNTGLEWWQNRPYNYGPLSIDRRHAFINTVTWQLPNFHDKPLLVREGIGGVQLTGVYRFQSGPYYSITGSAPTLGTRRANYVAGATLYDKEPRFVLAGHQAQWLNQAAWTAAPANAFGNAGVGQVELPSLQQVDLTLIKAFVITERVNFKFQADAFNALNHCNYSSLGTTATSGSSFGRLNGAYPNRQLQLGAKVTF
jgi:hypothetical protein